MTTEERRFQRVLGSLNTRESSTLVIATVASSASLVLLGLPIATQSQSPPPVREMVSLTWIGFLFPILGEMYRELTIFFGDSKDLDELFLYTGGVPPGFGTHLFSKGNWVAFVRRSGLRFFLLIPSALWLVNRLWPLYDGEGPHFLIPALIIAATSCILSVFEHNRNVQIRLKRGTYQVR